ncbi:hypothetical protein GQ457_10G019750 [Hibiscus cannabinus]
MSPPNLEDFCTVRSLPHKLGRQRNIRSRQLIFYPSCCSINSKKDYHHSQGRIFNKPIQLQYKNAMTCYFMISSPSYNTVFTEHISYCKLTLKCLLKIPTCQPRFHLKSEIICSWA